MKPGVCDERLAINRLIHGTGLIKVYFCPNVRRWTLGEVCRNGISLQHV
jgi:hypothetical protein